MVARHVVSSRRPPLALIVLLGLVLSFAVGSDTAAADPVAADQPPLDTKIVYLGRQYPEPPPLSLLDPILTDNGIRGAEIALDENNQTGRLLNHHYELIGAVVAETDDIVAKAADVLAAGHRLILADLEPKDLLAVADLPAAADAIILNVRSSADILRQEECRQNVLHVPPSSAMRTDALAQYLLWKGWRRWLVLAGTSDADLDYLAAIERAARRFGGKIVDKRRYAFDAGSRRTDTGHQQIQTQMPQLTQSAPEHDVVFVADAFETFGDYLLYRTATPRPVVGTHGLVGVAWHRSFEQYAATQMQSRFERIAKRVMTERDYTAWLGVRIFGEAVTRAGMNAPAAIKTYVLGDRFGVAGFKGEAMNFRTWDQQLRQPILVSGPRALVSISPQEGFLHPIYATDTLGVDAPETKCRMTTAAVTQR
jgi:ABC transporter substrate binding protein (PQQ-dependent alcohol dehydrogenase system)